MEDVKKRLKEEICIFCLRHKCKKCMNLQFKKQGNLKIYKCLNFRKGKYMDKYKEYLKYAFYDETNNFIAIIREDTPEEVIKEFQKEYDEVKFKE